MHQASIRKGSALLAGCALFVLTGIGFAGCSTDAVAIEACRAIEAARCEAAPNCEDTDSAFGISTPEQVENCKTFYIDGCLVGVENPQAAPSAKETDLCVATISALGACKAKGTEIGECRVGDKLVTLFDPEGDAALTACELLQEPERLKACSFIDEVEEEE